MTSRKRLVIRRTSGPRRLRRLRDVVGVREEVALEVGGGGVEVAHRRGVARGLEERLEVQALAPPRARRSRRGPSALGDGQRRGARRRPARACRGSPRGRAGPESAYSPALSRPPTPRDWASARNTRGCRTRPRSCELPRRSPRRSPRRARRGAPGERPPRSSAGSSRATRRPTRRRPVRRGRAAATRRDAASAAARGGGPGGRARRFTRRPRRPRRPRPPALVEVLLEDERGGDLVDARLAVACASRPPRPAARPRRRR